MAATSAGVTSLGTPIGAKAASSTLVSAAAGCRLSFLLADFSPERFADCASSATVSSPSVLWGKLMRFFHPVSVLEGSFLPLRWLSWQEAMARGKRAAL